ncbi:MAG: phage holin family protein [Actinobacteria bacterium]|nr:phage holin family protein [Actinomycetota bacterium]
MKFILHILVVAGALAVAHFAIPSGIELTGHNTVSKVGTLIVVALIFGIVSAVLKPIIKKVGCALYMLTFGLIGLVVNGLLLWLTSWVAGKLSLPFHITGFWPAFFGALIVGAIAWLMGLILDRVKG